MLAAGPCTRYAQLPTSIRHLTPLRGSVPFILREHLSYSQLGVFALSNYPYSLKLLWSPIVDSTFFPSVGRRKSWIIPMQLVIGSMMLYISRNAERLFEHVRSLLSISCAS